MLLATKIDPRSKGMNFEAELTGEDFLELEYQKLSTGSSLPAGEAQPNSSSFMAKMFINSSTPPKNEVQQYLGMEAIGYCQDPLKWWAARSASLPLLAQLARKYLAVPATSVPSERLFSDSGHVMGKRRTRLSAQIFGKIVFCRGNCQHFGDMFPEIEDVDEDAQESGETN